jgi:hypothetical protein
MSFRGDGSVMIFPRLERVLPHLSYLLHPESLIWMHSQRYKAATKQLEVCTGRLLPYGAARPGGRCSEEKLLTAICETLQFVLQQQPRDCRSILATCRNEDGTASPLGYKDVPLVRIGLVPIFCGAGS